MDRTEILNRINNSLLMNTVIKEDEASKIVYSIFRPYPAFINSTTDLIAGCTRIDDFFVRKDADDNLILAYFPSSCYSCSDIDLGNCIDIIGDYAFFGNKFLRKISGKTVKKIGKFAFEKCEKLEEVSFPSVIDVGNSSFSKCKELKGFIGCPSKIGDCAFSDCMALKALDFSSTREIGSYAFADSGIKSVVAPKLQIVYAYGFSRSKVCKFELPENVSFGVGVFDK